MGPCFEGGVEWCSNGFVRILNSGRILGDHRICSRQRLYVIRFLSLKHGSRTLTLGSRGYWEGPQGLSLAVEWTGPHA